MASKNTKKAEIPHIFHVIPSFAHGGVPIRISYLMNHFGKKARHSLFSTNRDYACTSRLSNEIDFNIPDLTGIDKANLPRRLLNYRRVISSLKPDLLLTYQWGAAEWAMANCIMPLCRHYHLESGFGPEEAAHTLLRRNWFRRLALRKIEGIIVPSQNLVTICQSDWHIPARKIHYIPNGVDCDKYASPPLEGIIPDFTKQPGEVVIGTMTPLRPEKNLPRLITAFRDLVQRQPDHRFSLIIMGEGGERPMLENLIREYNLTDKIYLPGHIDDPARALGWLDIYALSSDTEQMPNSLNQAMAASLPIAGMDVGDVKFMMHQDGKPFIAPAGDDPAFTKVLTDLALNRDLRERLGRINKLHVKETFDQSRMFRDYAKIWDVPQ